jgi:type II secretory pathway pseudopilin PulG
MKKIVLKKGFTLLETLLSVGLVVILFNVITLFSKDVFSLNATLSGSLSAQENARVVLRQIVKELRTASISNTGSYPIIETLPTRVRFFSDLEGDGVKEEVQYYIASDGKTLKKAVLKPTGAPLAYNENASTTSTVISNVVNGTSIFSYFDKNYTGTSAALSQPVDIAAVRLVKIDVTLDNDPNRSPVPIVVSSQVSLRNLKDNY